MHMSKKNYYLFIVLQVIAWLIFVGLSIEAGALIVNFVYSMFKPEVISRLYQKLDLSQLYNLSEWAYYSMYSFILVISILKALLFYTVVIMVSKLDLAKPFSTFVAKQISRISYYAFSIGILSYMGQQAAKNLQHRGFNIEILKQFWADSEAFIFMAAVVYIIAVIFKKGVDLQNENDLTV